jgi:hypothetical protein
LERKYGGRDRAHSAATIIQRRYREYRLKQHFEKKVTAGTGGNRLEQSSKKHQGFKARKGKLIFKKIKWLKDHQKRGMHRLQSTTQ